MLDVPEPEKDRRSEQVSSSARKCRPTGTRTQTPDEGEHRQRTKKEKCERGEFNSGVWAGHERAREEREVRKRSEGKKRQRTTLKIARCPPRHPVNRCSGIGVVGNFCVVGEELLVRRRLPQPKKAENANEKTRDSQESQGRARHQWL